MNEYPNAEALCHTLSEAWIGIDELLEFVEEHDLWEVLDEIAERKMDEICKVNSMIDGFYQFSGSDDSTWDEWTDPIFEFAGNLFQDVAKEIGMLEGLM